MHSLLNFQVDIENVENIVPSTELDGKNITQYAVRVSTNLSVWEVSGLFVAFLCIIPSLSLSLLSLFLQVYRRFSDFAALRDILLRQFPQLCFPELPSKNNTRRHSHSAGSQAARPSVIERKRKSLELFLRQLMTIDQIWVSSAFIEFLDDSPAPSLGMQIQFTAVSNQVQYLRGGYLALERKLEKAEAIISAAVGAIRELQRAPSRRNSIQSIAEETDNGGLLPEFKTEKPKSRPLSWRSLMRAANIGGVYLDAADPNSPKTEVESWEEGEERLSMGTQPEGQQESTSSPLGDLRFYQRRPSNGSLPGFGVGAAGVLRPMSTDLSYDVSNANGDDSMSDDSDIDTEASHGTFLGFSANTPSNTHSKRPSYASIVEEPVSVKDVASAGAPHSEDGTTKPLRRKNSLALLWKSVDEEPETLTVSVPVDADDKGPSDAFSEMLYQNESSNPHLTLHEEPAVEIVLPEYFSDGSVPAEEVIEACGQGKAFDQVLDMIHVANHGANRLLTRSNAVVFLAKHVKKCVMAKALAMGNCTVLNCLLPDDPLDITLILWKGSEGTWQSSVSDYFVRLASLAAAHADQLSGWAPSSDPKLNGNGREVEEELGEWEELYEDLCNSSITLGRFAAKVVAMPSAPSADPQHEIVMAFDGLRVNLVPNARTQLCMTAFYEEFSGLVGTDCLFKKSLVLLRAWWLYETPLYGVGNAASALSEDALTLMLCAVFNLYHESIKQPVQALAAFFAEYGDFDWMSDAVTLQGRVSLADVIDGTSLPMPNAAHVAGAKVVATYVNVYDPGRLSYSSSRAPVETDSPSSGVASGVASPEERNSLTSPVGVIGPVGGSGDDMCAIDDAVSSGNYSKSPLATSEPKQSFALGLINIVHPFLASANMVAPEKIDESLANCLKSVFNVGASRFRSSLAKITECDNTNSSSGFAGFVALSNSLFPGLTGKYGDDYLKIVSSSFFVPENLNFLLNPSSVASSANCLATLDGLGKIVRSSVCPSYSNKQAWFAASPSVEELWNKIHYANLLLFGYVSDHALWSLCVDVLQDRGFIPVGEIGKFLQELTGSVSMSGILKDKYGGLKKFLELHGSDFLISGNHPFNPNVYLKRALTAVEQECIERGETPTSFLVRYKKKSQKKKKSSSTAGASGASPIDSAGARDAHGNPIASHSKIHKSSLSAPTPTVSAAIGTGFKASAKSGTNSNKANKHNVRTNGSEAQSNADSSFSQWAHQRQGQGQGRESVFQQQQRARQQYEYQTKVAQEHQRRFMYGAQQQQQQQMVMPPSSQLRSPTIYSQALPGKPPPSWQNGAGAMGPDLSLAATGGMGESQESVSRRRSSYPMKQLAVDLLDSSEGDLLSQQHASGRYGAGAPQPDHHGSFQQKSSPDGLQSVPGGVSAGLGAGLTGALFNNLQQSGGGGDEGMSFQQQGQYGAVNAAAPSPGRYHGLLHSNQLGGELLGRDSISGVSQQGQGQEQGQWGRNVLKSNGSSEKTAGSWNSEGELGQLLYRQGRNFF